MRRPGWDATIATNALALALALHADHGAAEAPRSVQGPSVLRSAELERHAEQGILTPVPIEIELPGTLAASRVLVHYRVHGSPDWTTLLLSRAGWGGGPNHQHDSGSRWVGAIPCLEVSTITGDIKYYIRVHAADGAVIAYSGSRHRPYRVSIVHEPAEESRAAARCPDPADCPPGLPGCPSEEVERIPCRTDADCEGGLSCGWDGYCELDTRESHWFGIDIESGLGFARAAGACSVQSQETRGYTCYREDGQIYTGEPLYTNEPLTAGFVPVRVLVGYDALVSMNATLGGRIGYVLFGSGPTAPSGTSFVPYSAEIRAAHWFGDDPFGKRAFRPYVLVEAGYAMYDMKMSVSVREDPRRPAIQGGNDLEQELEVWKRAGDVHAGLGLGALYASDGGLALSGELGLEQVFPFGAFVADARVGVRAGF